MDVFRAAHRTLDTEDGHPITDVRRDQKTSRSAVDADLARAVMVALRDRVLPGCGRNSPGDCATVGHRACQQRSPGMGSFAAEDFRYGCGIVRSIGIIGAGSRDRRTRFVVKSCRGKHRCGGCRVRSQVDERCAVA